MASLTSFTRATVRFMLVSFLPCELAAQNSAVATFRIQGDTLRPPGGCSAQLAIKAVQRWFRAVATGDTALAVASIAPTHGAFSVIPFAKGERAWRGDTSQELIGYASARARAHEVLTLRNITFGGWLPRNRRCKTCERRTLGFVVEYDRSAADLPAGRHQGIGKGAYECSRGLISLNLAPVRKPATSPSNIRPSDEE